MAAAGSCEQLQEILDRSHKYLKQLGLSHFLLTLPLHGAAATSNQQGIREKILKNKSYVVTPHNPCDSFTRDSPESITYMEQVCDRLTSEDIVGFVLVIAEYLGPDTEPPEAQEDAVSSSAYQYRPVAGGIVELLDEHERAIRGLWCRRSLSPSLSDSLLKVTTMRLLAHAFDWQHPNNPTRKVNSKLVSTLEVHSLGFPRDTYDFLTTSNGLNLSKHWETPEDGGAHNDSPHQRCKCLKLADKSEAWQFWGISESRFLKAWASRKDSLIPIVVPPTLTEQLCRPSVKRVRLSKLKHSYTTKKHVSLLKLLRSDE